MTRTFLLAKTTEHPGKLMRNRPIPKHVTLTLQNARDKDTNPEWGEKLHTTGQDQAFL